MFVVESLVLGGARGTLAESVVCIRMAQVLWPNDTPISPENSMGGRDMGELDPQPMVSPLYLKGLGPKCRHPVAHMRS